MDWAFMGKYAPMYVEAAGLTLRIGCAGVLLSIVLGGAVLSGAFLPCAGIAAARGGLRRRRESGQPGG